MGDIDASNKIIHDLIKDIPNVYWVDAQQYLPKDSVMAEGKYLYGDQDHLTNFGAYYMAKEFSKYQRVMTPEQVKNSTSKTKSVELFAQRFLYLLKYIN